jgi:hypothetical protein
LFPFISIIGCKSHSITIIMQFKRGKKYVWHYLKAYCVVTP